MKREITDTVILYHGDCREVMSALPENSVDAIVTDPPYELGFMGKKWDSSGVAFNLETWQQALRVLKPGGHMLAFGGARTSHRMVCAIEDAGFEIRDTIMWIYGSGFPKSMDVAKSIDKTLNVEREVIGKIQRSAAGSHDPSQSGGRNYRMGGEQNITAPATDSARQWDGWGTALKPAHEPICVARKPLIGTVAQNVLEHGTGALNIDECRVPCADIPVPFARPKQAEGWRLNQRVADWKPSDIGRWPANVIHDGSDEVLEAFPQAPGQIANVSLNADARKTQNAYGAMRRGRDGEMSANSENTGVVGFKTRPGTRRLDTGSAARFFYCAKASRSDRNEGCQHMERKPLNWSSGDQSPGAFQAAGTDKTSQNNHPTVKPTALMRYLCRLITPPHGVILDFFMGSGSTGRGAVLEGFGFIGIEQDAHNVDISEARIRASIDRAQKEAAENSAQSDLFTQEAMA